MQRLGVENYAFDAKPGDPVIHRVVGRSFTGQSLDPPLSLKCMFGGSARYVVGGRQYHRVDDSCFLLLNRGHDYVVEKKSAKAIETFCVFFPADLVPAVAQQCTSPDYRLLDDERDTWPQFNHYEHQRPHEGAISRHILKLREIFLSKQLDDEVLEEQLSFLALRIVTEHLGIRKRISGLPQAKLKTRSELFRRIHLARDYIHAHFAEPFSLNETARYVSMSSFHFLRSFSQITGETPLSYLQQLRIDRSEWLLRRTDLTVSEIAFRVGYQSPASFSTLFKKHKLVSPSEYRRLQN